MMKVIEAHYPIIKQTIKRAPTFVYSILDQLIEGTVYTDTENLQTLLFQTKSGIYFVAGDSIHTVLDDQLVCCFQQSIEQKKRFTLFSYSEQWNIKIEQLLHDQLRKLERYTFTFDEGLYDSREEREVPNFEVMPITHHHIKNAQAFTYAYYDEYWDSTVNFLENGFGYCLVQQEQTWFYDSAKICYLYKKVAHAVCKNIVSVIVKKIDDVIRKRDKTNGHL